MKLCTVFNILTFYTYVNFLLELLYSPVIIFFICYPPPPQSQLMNGVKPWNSLSWVFFSHFYVWNLVIHNKLYMQWTRTYNRYKVQQTVLWDGVSYSKFHISIAVMSTVHKHGSWYCFEQDSIQHITRTMYKKNSIYLESALCLSESRWQLKCSSNTYSCPYSYNSSHSFSNSYCDSKW